MLIEPKGAVSSLDSAALHFPNMKKRGLIILAMLVLVVASLSGCRRADPSSLSKTTIDGVTSYYTYSNMKPGGSKEGLPAIIFIGHPLGRRETLQRFVGQFSEPVLLIWCGLLSDLDEDTLVDDKSLWQKKRQDLLVSFKGLKERLRFDEKRVYLTGFSFTGAYAWMLAYDRPELYAGVVAMSAVSYPAQLQQNLESAVSVVTVVVRGENDAAFPRRLAQEKETGRVIEAKNPHSRFVLKQGEGHGDVAKYWLEYLKYILQFSKAAGGQGTVRRNLNQSSQTIRGDNMRIRKQYVDLVRSDFEQYPIWEFCLDEEDVEGQDETTMRPRTDMEVPEPGWGPLVVGVEFTLNDGTVYDGMCDLDDEEGFRMTWPEIRTEQGFCSLYFGICTPERAKARADEVYRLLNKAPKDIFPVKYRLLLPGKPPGLEMEGTITGFSYDSE